MCHFWAQKGAFASQEIFLENYYYYFHLPIGPFHCAKFKKFLQWIQNHGDAPFSPFHCVKFLKNSSSGSWVIRMWNFWAQNGPFPQMIIFFRKPVNEPFFFYSCQSTCQKSKSDINLLVKYWWLNNTEISLSESHFCL